MDFLYCPYCGCKINSGDEFCTMCDSEFPCKYIQLKVPVVSAILSAFFPGLGQMYNGDRLLKGLLIFFGFAIGSLFYFLPGLLVWIFGMYDAYKTADDMDKGKIRYVPAEKRDILLIVFIPLVAMLIMLAVTIYFIYSIYGNPEQLLYEMMYYSNTLQI